MDKIISGRDFARRVGVSDAALRGYLKRDDFPCRRSPPWQLADVGKVAAWRQGLQEDRASDQPKTAQAGQVTVAAKLETMLFTRAKRKRLVGQLVDRAILESAVDAFEQLLARSFDELERSLPANLAGKDPASIEQTLHDRFIVLRHNLANTSTLSLDISQS